MPTGNYTSKLIARASFAAIVKGTTVIASGTVVPTGVLATATGIQLTPRNIEINRILTAVITC
jgi:hypothetical protein